MSRLRIRLLVCFCAPIALGGCGEMPAMNFDSPAQWASLPASEGTVQAYPNAGWVEDFGNAQLTEAVKIALAHNYDLKQAETNIAIAKGHLKKAKAELFPVLNLSGLARRSGSLDSSDGGGFNFSGGSGVSSNNFSGGGGSTSYDVTLDASWEADVWGRVRAGKKAALYEYYAAEDDYEAARQSLAAQTARAYLMAVETDKQLALAHTFEKNMQETLDVTQAFYDEGLISLQDVHLVKADLARARESIRNAESAHLSALRGLEVLMGRYPAASAAHGAAFPALPDPVPAGLPADLLERRPDLIAAERRVNAAFQRKKQAVTARLPKISLSGTFGGSSDQLRNLTDPANVLWSLAGNLLFPIFNAGSLQADVEIRTAEQEAAGAAYNQAALHAFSDAETALSNERLFRERAKDLDEAYENAQKAEAIANANFKAGETDLLDLLQIKRSTIAVEIDRIRAQRELLEQRVNLHLSLGGAILRPEVQPQPEAGPTSKAP